MTLKKKKASIEKKFADKNYILLQFESKTSTQDGIVLEQDLGIIDLDVAVDWKAVFNELVINCGHEVVGGNFPAKAKSLKVSEAAKIVASHTRGLVKEVVEPTPRETKTEEKVKEVKARQAAKKAK